MSNFEFTITNITMFVKVSKTEEGERRISHLLTIADQHEITMLREECLDDVDAHGIKLRFPSLPSRNTLLDLESNIRNALVESEKKKKESEKKHKKNEDPEEA